MSNIRTLPLSREKVFIGESAVDLAAERQAEEIIRDAYPEIMVVTSPEGKRHIPLKYFLILEKRYQAEKQSIHEDRFNEGYRQGLERGHATGLAEGQKEARQVVASLSGLIADVTRQRQALLEEARQKILEMALKIAEKLTFDAARLDPEITMVIISGAIDELLDKKKIKIKVNPDHLPLVEQQLDRFRGRDTAIKELQIEADPRVRWGGCFIETSSGDIDARLESMTEIIRQAILGGESPQQ